MFTKKPAAAAATLLTLCVSALMPAPALAQQAAGLQRVEVSGKPGEPVRHDVTRSCPGIAATLQEVLEKSWYLEQKEATVRVSFRLEGEDTYEVKSRGGPLAYRLAVSRAVSGMQCNRQAKDGQLYSFEVHFVAPRDEDTRYRLALKTS